MKLFATVLFAAAIAHAQQQGQNQGPNLSEGSNAVSNPNVNNGDQFQGSFVDSSRSGGNVVGPDGKVGSSFNHQASNSAILDSNFVNPSENSLSGNKGDTANGEGNSIGDIIAGLPAFPTPVLAQLQGSTGRGPNVAAEPNVVADPIRNLGVQSQGSRFEASKGGANAISGMAVGAFNNKPVNEAELNNNIANPSESNVASRVGSTANRLLKNVRGGVH
ncbi:hypothetical protein GGI22_005749 [Coemansia erecta]|nr:hypothetical protein GGI22_005749 [Coemansia erecta]